MASNTSIKLIRHKIRSAIANTTATALLITSLVFVVFMGMQQREQIYDNIKVHALRTGISSIFGLSFDNRLDVEKILCSLDQLPNFSAAAVYREDGSLFASHMVNGSMVLPKSVALEKTGSRYSIRGHFIAIQPIISGEDIVGYVSIASTMHGLYRMLLYIFAVVFVGLLGATAISYLLVHKFQRILSAPIEDLSATVRKVTETSDYSLRTNIHTSDEIGQLALDFNHMLAEVQTRDEDLISNELRFRTLVDEAVDSIFLIREDGGLVDCNPMASKSLILDRASVLSKTIGELVPEFDQSNYSQLWKDVYSGQQPIECTYMQRSDDSRFPAEIKLGPIDQYGERLLVAFCRDITQRVEAAKTLQQAEERLQHSQKMDSIGRLAGGVAHDFNNMLTGIIGATELLQSVTEDETSQRYVQIILDSAEQAACLTKKLLLFSRKSDFGFTAFDVHSCIQDALTILRHSIGPSIQIIEDYGAASFHAMGDPVLIQNAVINLGINARDAMEDGGILTIATKTLQLSTEDCAASTFEMKPGEFMRIDVSDTGTGISPELIVSIFDPFFTTKEMGKGTGMGLATIYGAMKKHHGCVDVKSEEGKGSTFSLLLPITSASVLPSASLAEPILDDPSAERPIRILLVDDEATIRRTLPEFLRLHGCIVIVAEDGEAGLMEFKLHHDDIDIVIMDLLMPRMSGDECFREMKKINPDVKVVIITGYSKETSVSSLIAEGVIDVVRKPFKLKDLFEIIRNIISK